MLARQLVRAGVEVAAAGILAAAISLGSARAQSYSETLIRNRAQLERFSSGPDVYIHGRPDSHNTIPSVNLDTLAKGIRTLHILNETNGSLQLRAENSAVGGITGTPPKTLRSIDNTLRVAGSVTGRYLDLNPIDIQRSAPSGLAIHNRTAIGGTVNAR